MPSVLILGAGSDIGFAIAKKFASEKYDVMIAARNSKQLKPMQSDINIRYGVQCSLHAFDAADFGSHNSFYNALSTRPDVTAYVIGYMNENEKVISDWNESLKTINANYTGAVSI